MEYAGGAVPIKNNRNTKNLRIIRTTMPLELTAQELAQTQNAVLPRELIVYTHLPLMVSEQCVKKHSENVTAQMAE